MADSQALLRRLGRAGKTAAKASKALREAFSTGRSLVEAIDIPNVDRPQHSPEAIEMTVRNPWTLDTSERVIEAAEELGVSTERAEELETQGLLRLALGVARRPTSPG